jgi:O-succinylbenzoate synthase
MQLNFKPHILKFIKPGGTSRGVLTEKPSHLLSVLLENGNLAYGEISTIPGLSIDTHEDILRTVADIQKNPDLSFWLNQSEVLNKVPAVKFALETLALDIESGGEKILFKSDFTNGKKGIAINGLIWMGEPNFMQQQIEEKLAEGFSCIKMKIGAIDFETEYKLLREIRKNFDAKTITLRVDANGAFSPKEAPKILEKLALLDIHSIEQPIKPHQINEMSSLCERQILPIALDEELIGVFGSTQKEKLLTQIKPQYIILKPSLLGGLAECDEWINLCKKHNVDFWITSALEGNIGLNAIAQYTFDRKIKGYQGLGTGKLFSNNFDSPLVVKNGYIWHKPELGWAI